MLWGGGVTGADEINNKVVFLLASLLSRVRLVRIFYLLFPHVFITINSHQLPPYFVFILHSTPTFSRLSLHAVLVSQYQYSSSAFQPTFWASVQRGTE